MPQSPTADRDPDREPDAGPTSYHSHGGDDGHDHVREGDHDHRHRPEHDAEHDHKGLASWWHRLRHRLVPHSHDSGDRVDQAMQTSREGMRTLWISLLVLAVTAVLQASIVLRSGSVALLSDTLHNAADALTAVPLGVAFLVGRRAATRRYTYGFGRAEDLAGIVVVAVIAASAVLAAWQGIERFRHPAEMTAIPFVAAAGVVGFAGNELVARYRIRTGRRIGSAALVADGLHARTDGFTSLAVVVAAGGAALGWWWVDPVIGLAIAAAILIVLRDAAREIYRRLMDAIDPDILDVAERTLRSTPGVREIGAVRMRWIGHHLRAEADIAVDPSLPVVEAHAIAVAAEHRLIHAVPRLAAATVHTDPHAYDGTDHHTDLAHHRPQ
ncbi:MAG TPA: cation diffusion facilitator family transporter [Mycobacterium sp.]|nr:cation diffusion facilitator family transporter [Mycobacterium sp.]